MRKIEIYCFLDGIFSARNKFGIPLKATVTYPTRGHPITPSVGQPARKLQARAVESN
jgi:hypothetical protein